MKIDLRRPEDEMRECEVIFARTLSARRLRVFQLPFLFWSKKRQMTHLSSTKNGARQRILNLVSAFVLFSIKVKEELGNEG